MEAESVFERSGHIGGHIDGWCRYAGAERRPTPQDKEKRDRKAGQKGEQNERLRPIGQMHQRRDIVDQQQQDKGGDGTARSHPMDVPPLQRCE
jgi:hypothetical protein